MTWHAQAGAAAALLLSPCDALANEFDIMNEPKPTTNYVIDDAGVLNKTTRKNINDQLSRLEVCSALSCIRRCSLSSCCAPAIIPWCSCALEMTENCFLNLDAALWPLLGSYGSVCSLINLFTHDLLASATGDMNRPLAAIVLKPELETDADER